MDKQVAREDKMRPQAGGTFQHKHFLSCNTDQPITCRITTVRGGRVYFRPLYGVHEDGTDWLGTPYFLTLAHWQEDYA